MIVTLAHQNDKSRYQTSSLNDNHPEILMLTLLRFIPHSEHPIAYDKRPKFIVKFLKHNLFPPLSSSSKSIRTESSATPSEKGVGSPWSYGSANTPLSSSMGSMGSPMTIGSPMLRGKYVNAAEETEHRDFEFKDEKGIHHEIVLVDD